MKREILFRAQKVDNKAWVEGYYYPMFQDDSEAFILSKNDGIVYQVITESVCQFTGLTDKNGTKIFEGDIIKIFWDDDYSEETITYDCKYGYYMYGNNPICELIGDNEFEVIGDIFDSPELLK